MPLGQETASALGAKAWISAHDGDKDVRGLASRLVKKRRYLADEVQRTLDQGHAQQCLSPNNTLLRRATGGHPTEVMALEVGDEITMTSEGIWEEEALFADEDGPSDLQGLGLDLLSEKNSEEGELACLPTIEWMGTQW